MADKCLKELVIRIVGDDNIEVKELYEDGENKAKYITNEDLITLISGNTRMIGMEVEPPENTFWYREEANGTKRIILKFFNQRVDYNYMKTDYPNVLMPDMLFGFVIDAEGMVRSRKVICVAADNGKITRESKTYQYMFSNVHGNQEFCMGGNKFNKLKTLQQVSSLPYFILQLPNNDDMYSHKRNSKDLNYRDLIVTLQNMEVFDKKLLAPTGSKVNDFIKLVVDSY